MLARGTRVGAYEIEEAIGAGGMGEVYRARDLRLGRDVAIKILAERSRMDSQGLHRLEREAQALASLNHPNIATLHAIEPFGDTQALILEFVEGETLSGHMARGALPLPEAMAIAGQIAAALAAAHERGVVHRDLKPSNVKLRPDGTVKLLDFGLAKFGEATSHAAAASDVTMTMAGEPGLVVGTPAYMSPEQARGMPIDKRVDIWAFGCVLFEMLAGVPPFAAERTSDVLAKIIEREPDYELLPATTPRAVRNLLGRCLRKDPRDRLRDVGDARLYLEESVATGALLFRPHGAWPWRRWTLVGLPLLAGVVVAATAFLPLHKPAIAPTATALVTRFTIAAPAVRSAYGSTLAISPDGSRIAYMSTRGLLVRQRDRLESVEIFARGMSGMGAPFFSPDGEWIAYTDSQSLAKVPVTGGAPVEIADSGVTALGSWSESGIVYATMNRLFRVPGEGGPPVPLPVEMASNEHAVFPQLLPGDKAVLFTVVPGPTNTPMDTVDSPDARVELHELAIGQRRTLLRGASRALYVASGHLLYVSGSTLYAVAFDLQRLQLRGKPVPVVTGLRNLEYAVSNDGTLVYRAGGSLPDGTLVWVDRQGREEPLDAPPRQYTYPRISPDGARIALDMQGPQDRDIFLWDMRSRGLTRFSIDPTGNPLMAWSPDGRSLAYGTGRFGVSTPVLQAVDGPGEPQRLMHNDRLRIPTGFDPQGRLLLSGDVPGRGRDVFALAMDGSGREEAVLHSAGHDLSPEISPDGRWVTYESDESGQYEVYVRPYPEPYSGGSWQISQDGGRHPIWSRDGGELYFRGYDGSMWAVPVQARTNFTAGAPMRLFANNGYQNAGRLMSSRHYDLSLDGRRFLMIKIEPNADQSASAATGLVVVLNWFEELLRLVPTGAPAGN